MAYNQNNRPQADGFVNLAVVDANGKEYRLGQSGVALREERQLDAQILKAAKQAVENGAENGDFTIKLVGRVRLTGLTELEDIDFGSTEETVSQ